MNLEDIVVTKKNGYKNRDVYFDNDFLLETEDSEDTMNKVEQACRNGARRIYACHGDGMALYVANGILRAGAGDKVKLGLIRNGHGNDLARSLGIFSQDEALNALYGDKTAKIDVGLASFTGLDGRHKEMYYLNFAGVGFDADAANKQANYEKASCIKLDYLLAIMDSVFRFSPKEIELEVDGKKFGKKLRYLVNFANGRRGGRNIPIAPNVSFCSSYINDEKFNLLIVGNVEHLWSKLHLIWQMLHGTHIYHPLISYSNGSEVKITGDNLLFHMDGEVLGRVTEKTPVELKVIPQALTMFYLDNGKAALLPR